MADITPINPSNNLPEEDPLEMLLDEVSDEDFGTTRIDDTTKAVLKDWSAQDFASIYTRFRPHLERHARRFLRNQSQVDEVVQDAFLYLMVTLPELDSELGVLRFLKWKTRLLCLDVIRASGRAQISDIDAHPEFEATNTDVSAEIEHAEDAAIVRLALSKLNPRHREVLIASMYEEKTSAQIAAQVGLTENATNQLIFRARSAFKKALLGDDVDTSGMSVSKILSVAARKAAFEAKKVGAQAMVFVLFLILGIGAVVNFTSRPNNSIQAGPAQSPSSQSPVTPVAPNQISGESSIQAPLEQNPSNTQPESTSRSGTLVAAPASNPAPSVSPSPFTQAALDKVFDSSKSDVAFAKASVSSFGVITPTIYRAVASQGIYTDFTFDYDAETQFTNMELALFIDGKTFFAKPDQVEVVSGFDSFGLEHIVFYGKASKFTDRSGKVFDDERLTSATLRLELVIAKDQSGVSSINLDVLRF